MNTFLFWLIFTSLLSFVNCLKIFSFVRSSILPIFFPLLCTHIQAARKTERHTYTHLCRELLRTIRPQRHFDSNIKTESTDVYFSKTKLKSLVFFFWRRISVRSIFTNTWSRNPSVPHFPWNVFVPITWLSKFTLAGYILVRHASERKSQRKWTKFSNGQIKLNKLNFSLMQKYEIGKASPILFSSISLNVIANRESIRVDFEFAA